jgi:hypothetical protein
MATNKKLYVLFITTKCNYCKNFFSKLKSNDELFSKFNVVDIDSVDNIPDEVDEVPCVYDGKQVYKGKAAFTWLNEISLNFLQSAGDGLNYSFVNGNEEKIFNNYSLLDQVNGSVGMDKVVTNASQGKMQSLSIDDLVSQRANELK